MAAADLRSVLTDYTIESWSQRDGLPPGNVWALAQDRDGYLWVGSESGLFRFDGVRFIRWDAGSAVPVQNPVRALAAASSGAVWVGFGDGGGINRIGAGATRSYGESDGLPSGAVLVLVEDAERTMWAGTEKGLYSLSGERWRKTGAEVGLPEAAVYGAFFDVAGTFHVGSALGVFRRNAGSQRFEQIEMPDEGSLPSTGEMTQARPRSFAQDAAGRVLVNDWHAGFHVAGEPQPSFDSLESGRGYRLLLDRRQNLWVGTIGQGLWRVRPQPSPQPVQIERATSLTGLLSDGVVALLEDREGNIWAGTTEGLCRLTTRRITQLTNYGLVVGIDLTPDGSVWVGTIDELLRFSSEGAEIPSARIPLQKARLRAIHADEQGTIWVATDRHLSRVVRGSAVLATVAPIQDSRQIELISSDFRGGVWLYDQEGQLLRWTNGRFERFALPPSLHESRVEVLYTDRNGRLWLALTDGRLAVMNPDETIRMYGAEDGLDAGIGRQIFEDNQGAIWLAARAGLSRLTNDRFVTLRAEDGFPVTNLTAITEDDVHDLWLGTGSGIIRLPRADIDKAAGGRPQGFQYRRYNRSDGLGGLPLAYNRNRRVVRAGDGRLWFVTSRGLTLIDPRALRDSHPPAPIKIEYATADGKRLEVVPHISLPAQTSQLEIDYSELNLTSPLRTRFRYRLEGFDADWIDAGVRRQAFYTNLPPRSYRFRVMASNADGTWADPGASWDFSIKPMFFQTRWFLTATVIAMVVALGGVWQLRLRQIRRQFSLLIGERVRLSRELHDTLLQSLVGIALQFDVIAADVQFSSLATQKRFVRLRKLLEEYIREARQSIWDLRSPKLERRDLVTALRDVGEHATVDHRLTFELKVSGEPRRFSQKVEEQLLRIGQEAVNNVVRHARANRIQMDLHYNDARDYAAGVGRWLRLRSRRPGRGRTPALRVDQHERTGGGDWRAARGEERDQSRNRGPCGRACGASVE